MPLKLASYNIHGAVGTDGHRDIDRIAAVIQEIDPDVLALQEVESRASRGGIDQARVLASALDLHCVEGPILMEGNGWYGNAILSKRPARDIRQWRYPEHGNEPRAAVSASIADDAGRSWRIVSTHLDLSCRFRWRQVQSLVTRLSDAAKEPLAIMADLNEWWPWAPSWRLLRQLGQVSDHVRTFPSRYPLLALDRIVLGNCTALALPFPFTTELSRKASDHLPIVVEVTGRANSRSSPCLRKERPHC